MEYIEKTGMQEISSSLPELPSPSREGMISFLSSPFIKGIGKVYARKIIDRFGNKILNKDFDFNSIIEEIPGIPSKNLEGLSESMSALQISPYIPALLYSSGLNDIDVEKIISHYGSRTEKILLWDPYDMVENVWKFSFFSADKIGKFLGILPDDPRRLKGAILTAVKIYAREGNMFATEREVLNTSSRITGIDKERIKPQIRQLISEGRIIDSLGGLYLPAYYIAEEEAAGKILEMLASNEASDINYEMPTTDIFGHPLSPDQKEAIETVLKNKVTVITGGPGTGKTTAVKGIIGVLLDQGKKIVLTAPTGRAAKRMSELIGDEAKTIHRLLGYSMGRGYKNKKLDADIIVIDEASMLEQVLFNHLLQAIDKHTKVVLVGDTDQLPAIGAGNVLKDMIDSGKIPVVSLKENFRQQDGSFIAENAAKIREGSIPEKFPSSDFVLVEEPSSKNIRERLLSLVSKEIPSYTGVSSKDIQVVTPQQDGPLGAKELNLFLQENINHDSAEIRKGVKKFRLGDRVMQTTNSGPRGVFNGETGWVSHIDPEGKYLTVSFNDGKVSTYGLKDLKELSLSYATTVHKMQGSETDYMVFILSSEHRPLLYRNLLYTGVSRAKKLCVIIGEGKALETAVSVSDKSTRNSNFKYRLK